jgi:hypothetical protein
LPRATWQIAGNASYGCASLPHPPRLSSRMTRTPPANTDAGHRSQRCEQGGGGGSAVLRDGREPAQRGVDWVRSWHNLRGA